MFFLLMLRPHPSSTLFPYTTLFRSYTRVSFTSPWKVMTGRYTREGDVRELLRATDDMFVNSRPGDELTLSFAADQLPPLDRKSTRLNSSHVEISYAVFCLKKKKKKQ